MTFWNIFEFPGILISRFGLNTIFRGILILRIDQNTIICDILVLWYCFLCVSFQHFRNFWINMEPKCKLKIHFYLFLHTTDPPPPQFTLNEQNHVSICLWPNSNFAINTPLTSIIQQNHFFHFTCFCMSKTYFISRSNLDNALSPNSITFVFGWKNLLSLWGVVIGKWGGGGRSGGKLNVRTKWAGVPNFGHSMIT